MTQDPGSGAPMSERMQSLLSRAVEDQLSEQRQLAGVLSDVRNQLSQLTSQLGAVEGGAGGGSAQIEQALGAIAGNVRDAVRLLGERLDTVGRLVQERGHDLAEQRALIGELKAAVDGHTGALAGVTGGLAALPAFGERIDALQGGLGGLNERLSGLEELVAAVGLLEQRSGEVDAGLRELRQAFSGVAARAAQLPGRDDLEAMGGRVAEAVAGLDGRLSRLETAVPTLLERLDALAETHEATSSSLRELADGVAVGDRPEAGGPELADLGSLRDEVAALREHLEAGEADDDDVQALMERLDVLHDGLLGADGVVARLAALQAGRDNAPTAAGLDADAVEDIVAAAVADSERRLADHVDEAVLTLAEALLRRRARQRPSVLGGVLGAAEVESAMAPPDADDDDAAPWDAPSDEDTDDATADEQSDVPDENDDEESRRRKPWWRPGG